MITFNIVNIGKFILLAIISYRFLKWLFTYIYRMYVINKIKGLSVIPLLGNVHQLKKRKRKFFNQIQFVSKLFKDEPLFRLWVGWHPIIVFHKAEHLDILMSSNTNTQKSFEYKFLQPWLGTGLLTSFGEKWNTRRRLITPTFHFEILNDFLYIMNEQSQELVKILKKKIDINNQIDIFQRITFCTLDIICETAMGKNLNSQNNENSDYVKAVIGISGLIFQRFFNPFYWNDFIYSFTKKGKKHEQYLEILHGLSRKVIMDRHSEFETSNYKTQKRIAFLDMLLKAKSEDPTITFDDIQEEVDTFMFEGHDTTAAAAGWACHLIGSHPDVQKKLHQEIDEILVDHEHYITNRDLKNLKYLECVIKETLRLFPSVPFFGRTLTQDDQVAGFRILKGSTAVIFPYMIHRDEKYYPEPEKFDPDRFLPENTKDRHPYAFIPFSAGKRNCIGQRFALMEEKIILANILRNFELKSLKTTNELRPITELILRPKYGIVIQLIPR